MKTKKQLKKLKKEIKLLKKEIQEIYVLLYMMNEDDRALKDEIDSLRNDYSDLEAFTTSFAEEFEWKSKLLSQVKEKTELLERIVRFCPKEENLSEEKKEEQKESKPKKSAKVGEKKNEEA